MENKNNLEEIWRDIAGYEGLYQVSNFGRVKSLPRVIVRNNGRIQTLRERILKPVNVNGYLMVVLFKNGKHKMHLVHRLVAQAFLPNPNGYSEVNHKDENKENNKVDNLEWCSREYNCNYGTRNERVGKSRINNSKISKQVVQIDKNTGDIIKIWHSTAECGRNGFFQSAVASCCRNERNYHKGYIWKYI